MIGGGVQAVQHTPGVEEIELHAKKADHLPVGLQVVLQPTSTQRRQQRRSAESGGQRSVWLTP